MNLNYLPGNRKQQQPARKKNRLIKVWVSTTHRINELWTKRKWNDETRHANGSLIVPVPELGNHTGLLEKCFDPRGWSSGWESSPADSRSFWAGRQGRLLLRAANNLCRRYTVTEWKTIEGKPFDRTWQSYSRTWWVMFDPAQGYDKLWKVWTGDVSRMIRNIVCN